MDIGTIFEALGVSFVLAIVIVVIVAAIVFAVIKKKKDYHPDNGIPKLVDDPERTEGSTDKKDGGDKAQ